MIVRKNTLATGCLNSKCNHLALLSRLVIANTFIMFESLHEASIRQLPTNSPNFWLFQGMVFHKLFAQWPSHCPASGVCKRIWVSVWVCVFAGANTAIRVESLIMHLHTLNCVVLSGLCCKWSLVRKISLL